MQRDLRVGGWLVQPSLGRISKPGLTVPVRAKVMDLLVYLAQHPAEVVSKDVLLRDVWGTDAISESALTRTIAEMRQALGDDVEQPAILETIPKRGYRLIAPVTSGADDEGRRGAHDRPVADSRNGRRPLRWALVGVGALLVGGAWISMRGSPVSSSPEAIGEAREPMRYRPVTALEGVEREPSLSPDGSQVAFIWNNDLYVKAVDSGEPHRIASNVFETAWSRDGQWIATFRNVGPPGHHKLLLVSPTGGSEQEIGSFHNLFFRSLDWSLDGKRIALTHKERPELSPAIFLVEIKSGKTQRITTPPPEANFDGDPTFSNDGLRLVYFRNFSTNGTGGFEIHTVSVDGRGDRTVTTLDGLPLGLGWAPEERALVLAWQTPENLARLWRIPLDGSPASAYEVGENAFRFSIVGHRLAYQQLVGNRKLWLASGPAAPVQETPRLFRDGSRDDQPRYSPDGQRLAYVTYPGNTSQIWVCQHDGTGCIQLTHQGIASNPRWSPDGESIVFLNTQGNNDLYIVNANGGVPRALTNDLASDSTPGFSRDGLWVYFNRKQSSEWQIFRVPSAGGSRAEQVSSVGGNSPTEGNDGWFYFSRSLTGTLERMRADGTGRQILKEGLPAGIAWTLWGGIPLVRQGDLIFKIDPQTRKWSEFWRLDASSLGPSDGRREGGCNSFDVSPDGRYVIYCVAKPQGDIILVENFR